MIKKVVISILMISFISLTACGRLMKSEETLLHGEWVAVPTVEHDVMSGQLLSYPTKDDQTKLFTKKEYYHFDKKTHELIQFNLIKQKVKFDISGNILTLDDERDQKQATYYRKNSVQYQKAKQAITSRVDEINKIWHKNAQDYLQQYEIAKAGTWSNKVSNAQVDLNRDSPDPDAKLIFSKPKYSCFNVSFIGGARDQSMSTNFTDKK